MAFIVPLLIRLGAQEITVAKMSVSFERRVNFSLYSDGFKIMYDKIVPPSECVLRHKLIAMEAANARFLTH